MDDPEWGDEIGDRPTEDAVRDIVRDLTPATASQTHVGPPLSAENQAICARPIQPAARPVISPVAREPASPNERLPRPDTSPPPGQHCVDVTRFLRHTRLMSAAKRPNILLIMGSVRAGRRCPQIAAWVLATVEQAGQLACEIIDLRDWNLPPEDEPGIPAKGACSHEHTRAWSNKIAAADGFIIVSPQYNWGYPAALKNALDHLYSEWGGKPLLIVTYGGHGGGKCAEQLRQVAAALELQPVQTMPAIKIAREAIENDIPQSAADLEPFEASLQQSLSELATMLLDTHPAAA